MSSGGLKRGARRGKSQGHGSHRGVLATSRTRARGPNTCINYANKLHAWADCACIVRNIVYAIDSETNTILVKGKNMFTLLTQHAGKWDVVGHTMNFTAICQLAYDIRHKGTNSECILLLDINGNRVAWDEAPDGD